MRKRLTYSNVIASLALFAALGGVAVAAGLPKNSVGPKQIKRGAVTAAKIRKQAVTSAKLATGAVTIGKLAPNSVGPNNIGNGAVTTPKLGASSVIASTIKNGVITTNKLDNEAVSTPKLGKEAVTTPKLGNEAVSSAKLGKGSVTPAKLSDEFGPVLGTLKSGQTLRGMFILGEEGGETALAGQTFQFPLGNAPTVNVIDPATATTPACPGLGGGIGQTPQAAGGQLCVYVTSKANLGSLTAPGTALTRLGFGLEAIASGAGSFSATGQWAVTAP
ncbi:MAG TPA: hypothetical protein VG816_06145 [Solirubrobacterales bacterium]|nr:hypothetical protein [Solirubrobacterales bacterium]